MGLCFQRLAVKWRHLIGTISPLQRDSQRAQTCPGLPVTEAQIAGSQQGHTDCEVYVQCPCCTYSLFWKCTKSPAFLTGNWDSLLFGHLQWGKIHTHKVQENVFTCQTTIKWFLVWETSCPELLRGPNECRSLKFAAQLLVPNNYSVNVHYDLISCNI